MENELEIPFSEIYSHYNLLYEPQAQIISGGTTRKLIVELFVKKNIIISRPLINEEMELFKNVAISIDTLGFGTVFYSDSTGDKNLGYNYLLAKEKKINSTSAVKLQLSYSIEQDSLNIKTFQFPIILVSLTAGKEIRKLTAYFDYELPNSILLKHNIKPYKQSNRTIIIE